MSIRLAHPSSPSLFAWLFALSSTALFIVICFAINDLAHYFGKKYALEEIRNDSLELPNARRSLYIQTLLTRSKYQAVRDILLDHNSSNERAIATRLFSALEQLISKHYNDATTTINQMSAEDLDTVEDGIEKLRNNSATLERSKQDLTDLDRKIQSLIAQHRLVANEFAAMFSFNSAYAEAEKKEVVVNKLLFYKNGILKDLPLLQELPDNIESLLQLKAQLEMLNAKVVTEGADAHSYFTDKLQSLRDKSLQLQLQFETFEKERESLIELEQKTSAALSEQLKNIKIELLNLALLHVNES